MDQEGRRKAVGEKLIKWRKKGKSRSQRRKLHHELGKTHQKRIFPSNIFLIDVNHCKMITTQYKLLGIFLSRFFLLVTPRAG